MGYELLVAFFLSVIVPLTVLGFIVFWVMTHRERLDLEDTWQGSAARKKREYVPARGEWPNRTSPLIRWHQNHRSFELSINGVEAGAKTRLSTSPHERLLGDFVIRSITTNGGGEKTNDPFFDRAFSIMSERPRGIAMRVLRDERARRALLFFWQRDEVALRYKKGRLTLEWPGRESNEARIDEAESVLAIFADSIDEAFMRAAA